MRPHEQPIGFWLKLVDRRLEEAFERALSDVGLQRRHWQTLQLLEAAPRRAADITAALAPFFDGAEPEALPILRELVDHGWVRVEADQYSLTPDGSTARTRLADCIQTLRRNATAGISQDEYAATLAVLARIADNLREDASEPVASGARPLA